MLDPAVPHLMIVAAFMVIVLKAAVSDLNTLQIPNRDIIAIVLLYPLYLSYTPIAPDVPVAAGIAAATLFVGFALYAGRLFGAGDVKMLAAVALWAGPELMGPFLLITVAAGGVLAIMMASRIHLDAAVLAHRCGAVRLSESITSQVLPYGAAIAAGSIYVAYRLLMLGA